MGANDAWQGATYLVKAGGGVAILGLVLAGLFAFIQWPVMECFGGASTCADETKSFSEEQAMFNLAISLLGGVIGAGVGMWLVKVGIVSADTISVDDDK